MIKKIEEFKNFNAFYVYGSVQYKNSGIIFLKDEIRNEILDFIKERLIPKNLKEKK